MASNALAEQRYALVVGNGAYENIAPLRNAPNDARLITDALETVGFDVTTIIDADVEKMQEALNNFVTDLDRAGQDAVGLFYFAGHGVSYDGMNYLIPIGSSIQQAAHLRYRTVSANEVLELMEAARNSTNILVLDACRNNPFRSFSLSGTRDVSRGLAMMDIAPTGSYIAYSTAPGEVAYDGIGNYSPFAEAFASEITTSNDTIDGMMIDVRVRVIDMTESMGTQPQIPWSNSSLTGRFWFNPDDPVAQSSSSAQSLQQPQQGQSTETGGEGVGDFFFVTDELRMTVFSGPSADYDAVGVIESGTPVEMLGSENRGFVEVMVSPELTGWVRAAFLVRDSDQIYRVTSTIVITMRTGPGNDRNPILLLESGTRVQLLRDDPESGFARVRTNAGTEGWVLRSYLESASRFHGN